MNEHEINPAEVERLERWLAQFPTPEPDAVTLERVKCSVRQVCAGDTESRDRMTLHAVASAKSTVRRMLDQPSSPSSAVTFRPWAPISLTAASIAFACVTYWTVPAVDVVPDADLAAFVAVMTREEDEVTAELMNLENEMALLAGDFRNSEDDWTSPSLLDVGDLLEDLSSDESVNEEDI